MAEEGNHYVTVGEVIVGKYLVERLLGVGGMAFVVSARHIDLDEHFALKFLNREFLADKNVVERFTREAKAACMIRSEHVARVVDVGVHEGAPFLVMEHLTGRDLCTVVNEGGALPIANAVEYVMQTCEALAVAHSLGIVHRDIKPENLFLVEHAGLPSIKLLDFGISKIALTGGDKSSRLTGKLTLGTPCYMSPEQIRSTASADPRSDLWSLGVVLYSLLTGREAFQADSVTETCAAVLEKDPYPLRAIRPEIPEGLAEVVMKCLAKNPDARYADVAELAVALVPFAPSRALVSAERSSSTMKTPRFRLEGKISSRPSLLKSSSSAPPSSIDGVTKSASSMLQATPLSLSLDVPLFDPSELAADGPADAFGTKEDLARLARDAESRGPYKTRRSPKHPSRRGRNVFLGAATLVALGVAVFAAQRTFDRGLPGVQAGQPQAREATLATPSQAAMPSVPVEELPTATAVVKRPTAAAPSLTSANVAPMPSPRARTKSADAVATGAAAASGEPAPTAPVAAPTPSAAPTAKVELGY